MSWLARLTIALSLSCLIFGSFTQDKSILLCSVLFLLFGIADILEDILIELRMRHD